MKNKAVTQNIGLMLVILPPSQKKFNVTFKPKLDFLHLCGHISSRYSPLNCFECVYLNYYIHIEEFKYIYILKR